MISIAQKLGYSGSSKNIYELRDWLREQHEIHVEVGSIWDDQTNLVESYFFTVTAPIHKYHSEPEYGGGGQSHYAMLFQGVTKALELLRIHNEQKIFQVEDDQLVVAYLKGYGEKNAQVRRQPRYLTNIEEYAYLRGRQGDYIEEGLTDDDIISLVRNELKEKEKVQLLK